MRIPVAFITDKNFVMQTGVAIYSMKQSKNPNTEYTVYVIMAECTRDSEDELLKVDGNGVEVKIIRTGLDQYRDIRQLSHIPISCLLKFNLCDLILEEDKVIYLDGDIHVRKDLTDLYHFELGDFYLAGVPSLDMIHEEKKMINAGIILFDAKKMRDSKMSEKLIGKRRELGNRGSMDQQTFNLLMRDQIAFLPYQYNCIPNKLMGIEKRNYPIEKLNKLYGTSFRNANEMVDHAAVIHYATGGKPWKYTYIKCADEWYQTFLSSPYKDTKIDRETAFVSHIKGVGRNLRRCGIKGLFERMGWYVRNFFGKGEYNSWG